MSTLERCPRREGFSEGRWITAGDGSRWCLPVLDEAAWDRFPRLRGFFAWMANGRPGEDGEPLPESEWYRPPLFLLYELIEANYEVGVDDLVGLLAAGGVVDYGPLTALTAYVGESGGELGLLRMADEWGVDRRELSEQMKMAGVLGPLPRWHGHDGIMFDN